MRDQNASTEPMAVSGSDTGVGRCCPFIAGVEAIRRGIAQPVGSLADGSHPPWKKDGREQPLIKICATQELGDIVFGGWDVIADDAEVAARKAGVLEGPRRRTRTFLEPDQADESRL